MRRRRRARAADEPEAVDLDPSVLARRLDAPATVGFLTGRPRGPAAVATSVAQGLLVAK